MNAPRETQNAQDMQDTDPTLEELKQELSDTDLQVRRGILFAAKYLFLRTMLAKGFTEREKIPYYDVTLRLKQLFPQQKGEKIGGFLRCQGDALNTAFKWAKEKVENELKVRRMAEQLKRRSPKATNEALEAEARESIELAKIFNECSANVIKAAGETGD